MTGSGKTQVFIELAKEIVKSGKQVIVLIPEISLTYQMVRRFIDNFGDRIGIIHSKLSQGEKYEQIEKAQNGDIDIMIFFWDPLTSQPHDPDVKALLRIAVLYDVAVAMSKSSADFLLSSIKISEVYDRNVIDYYTRIRKDNF